MDIVDRIIAAVLSVVMLPFQALVPQPSPTIATPSAVHRPFSTVPVGFPSPSTAMAEVIAPAALGPHIIDAAVESLKIKADSKIRDRWKELLTSCLLVWDYEHDEGSLANDSWIGTTTGKDFYASPCLLEFEARVKKEGRTSGILDAPDSSVGQQNLVRAGILSELSAAGSRLSIPAQKAIADTFVDLATLFQAAQDPARHDLKNFTLASISKPIGAPQVCWGKDRIEETPFAFTYLQKRNTALLGLAEESGALFNDWIDALKTEPRHADLEQDDVFWSVLAAPRRYGVLLNGAQTVVQCTRTQCGSTPPISTTGRSLLAWTRGVFGVDDAHAAEDAEIAQMNAWLDDVVRYTLEHLKAQVAGKADEELDDYQKMVKWVGGLNKDELRPLIYHADIQYTKKDIIYSARDLQSKVRMDFYVRFPDQDLPEGYVGIRGYGGNVSTPGAEPVRYLTPAPPTPLVHDVVLPASEHPHPPLTFGKKMVAAHIAAREPLLITNGPSIKLDAYELATRAQYTDGLETATQHLVDLETRFPEGTARHTIDLKARLGETPQLGKVVMQSFTPRQGDTVPTISIKPTAPAAVVVAQNIGKPKATRLGALAEELRLGARLAAPTALVRYIPKVTLKEFVIGGAKFGAGLVVVGLELYAFNRLQEKAYNKVFCTGDAPKDEPGSARLRNCYIDGNLIFDGPLLRSDGTPVDALIFENITIGGTITIKNNPTLREIRFEGVNRRRRGIEGRFLDEVIPYTMLHGDSYANNKMVELENVGTQIGDRTFVLRFNNTEWGTLPSFAALNLPKTTPVAVYFDNHNLETAGPIITLLQKFKEQSTLDIQIYNPSSESDPNHLVLGNPLCDERETKLPLDDRKGLLLSERRALWQEVLDATKYRKEHGLPKVELYCDARPGAEGSW